MCLSERASLNDLQVACVQLSDKVEYRLHWPTATKLTVNGHQCRVCGRPPNVILGDNQRDAAFDISGLCTEGECCSRAAVQPCSRAAVALLSQNQTNRVGVVPPCGRRRCQRDPHGVRG